MRSEPSLIYHNDAFVDEAMKRQRVSRDEVLQIARSKGMASMSQVGSVIMETNGSFSVLPHSQGKPDKLLSNVSRVRSDTS